MKILHVLYSPRAEGTPRIVLDWLTVSEYPQDLLFLTADGELRETFEKIDVWQHYNSAFVPSFKNAFKIAELVKKVCIERKPDVVIAWYLGFSHWIAMGAKRAGVGKNLAHAGNPAGDTFMGRYVHTWLSFWTGRWFGNRIIACSDYVMNSFKSIPLVSSKNIFSVYNCARIEKFLVQNNGVDPTRNNDFIMVATMEPHKDHKTLLNAWLFVQRELQDSKLLLAGDGSLRGELEQLSKSLLLKNVFFLGSRDDIPQLLQHTKSFVLSTTTQEGFGTVLIEAMAAGCTVLASDVAACREVLKGGEYGKLVEANDDGALARAMLAAAAGGVDEKRLAAQVSYARRFSPREMIIKYLAIANSAWEN